MSMRSRLSVLIAGTVLLAAGAAGLIHADAGLTSESTRVGGVPVEVVRSGGSHDDVGVRRPAVVVVHGYAGSGRLMRPFADTLVRRGYVVLLPDLAGHGANTRRLDVPSVIDPEIAGVVDYARGLDDVDPDRIALLGHSMGAGAVVRVGAADPRITATVAVSLPGVEAAPGPRRLLLLVGALEPGGIRAATERAADSGPGSEDDRRLVIVPLVEHISVLFAPRTHREAASWLDAATDNTPPWTGIAPLRRVLSGTALLLGALLLLIAAVAATPRRRPAPGRDGPRAGRPGRDGVGADGPGRDEASAAPSAGSRGTSRIGQVWAAVRERAPIWVVAAVAGAPGVVGGALLSLVAAAPVTGYLIGYFALTGAVLTIAAPLLAAYARRNADGHTNPAGAPPSLAVPASPSWWPFGSRTVAAAAGSTAAVRSGPGPRLWAVPASAVAGGVAVVVPVQLGLTLMVPYGDRWWLIAVLALATAALLHGARAVAGPGWDAGVLVLVCLPLPVAAVIGLAPGFLMLIGPLVAVLFVLYVGLAALGRNAAWWHPVAAGAVMIAWPVAAALPVSVS
ncbi:alpha/beta hydrolase [Catenuloplanes sp. NPDC051500]|uniref:alpha/beta hydrolase n=1 Tax=Catenuloplanes sp. NPDC051500 TaxID=3363959 RepID=UPI0037AF19F7